jgi:hypothetical protein
MTVQDTSLKNKIHLYPGYQTQAITNYNYIVILLLNLLKAISYSK